MRPATSLVGTVFLLRNAATISTVSLVFAIANSFRQGVKDNGL
jgi:hypothetical protein